MLKLLNKYYAKPTHANAQKLIDYAETYTFAITGLTPMQCDAFDTIKREHMQTMRFKLSHNIDGAPVLTRQ
tara:strand:- start:1419 stop:1631 length:213 start_codon:yes stop_codon:yes gene_type:complete